MHIDIVTLFPDMLEGPFGESIIRRAVDKGLVSITLHQLRDYSTNRYRSVDDYPYGGGAGMVMMPEPLVNCIEHLQKLREYDEIIFMTPDGALLDQPLCNNISLKNNLLIICGHYKGIDERVREHFITMEISIGDYVLSGGELAAAVLCDSIIRIIPGVLGDETSALSDSFQDGLLSPPCYTRPADFRGWKVPPVLLSGNEKEIRDWRHSMAMERTRRRRPGLLDEEK